MSMNACLCVRAYDTCTQSVLCFARYAQAHVTGSGFVADACACWCVIVAKVLCVKPALFIEITAPCAAYCVCEGCEAGFFCFFLLTLAPLWDFLLGATFCWLGKPRSLSLEVNIQHDWLGFLKTHRQDGIYCYDMTCSGIRYIGGIQPLIFTNNAVQCSWVILCPNSQRLYRAARQFQYERKFCGLADQS